MNTLTLQTDHVSSPIGGILILSDQDGFVRALEFENLIERMNRLLCTHYGIQSFTLLENRTPSPCALAVQAYFQGDLTSLDGIEIVTGGTPFQRTVWSALRRISAGETSSYGALATRIGQPTASRAVGLANSTNLIPLIVPCHRVIGADGSLTGYGGGLERKRWLLEHERNHSAIV
ncbi:MAG: methylated-DNA--[protein]-cysteine S-methyltransferase [Burkholderiales bacterium]